MMHWDLHSTKFFFWFVCACTLLLFPVTSRARTIALLLLLPRIFSFASSFLFPSPSFLSRFRFPLLRMFGWVGTRVRHLFLNARANTVWFNLYTPRAFGLTLLSRGEITRHTARHQWNRSWFCHHQIHRPGLRHWWTFSWKSFLSFCRHSTVYALLLVWKKEMAARKHREIKNVQQMEKMLPLIACETSLG